MDLGPEEERRCGEPAERRCGEPTEPVSATQVALLVIAAALLVYYVIRFLGRLGDARERFASKRAHEVHDRAREVFAEGGADAPYTLYKALVPGADPVQYSDVRRLYKAGQLTPRAVESVL